MQNLSNNCSKQNTLINAQHVYMASWFERIKNLRKFFFFFINFNMLLTTFLYDLLQFVDLKPFLMYIYDSNVFLINLFYWLISYWKIINIHYNCILSWYNISLPIINLFARIIWIMNPKKKKNCYWIVQL